MEGQGAMNDGGQVAAPPMADPVTGAVPRALLQPMLADALARAERDGTRCALFLFDVDFFKTVNDAYGHQRGDQVLRQLADRVKSAIRPVDTLFRYGGDEFVLLLPGIDQADALRLAVRLTDEVRGRKFAGTPPLAVSVSLGVATYPDDADTGDELIARADRRNYLAKRRGRGAAGGCGGADARGPRAPAAGARCCLCARRRRARPPRPRPAPGQLGRVGPLVPGRAADLAAHGAARRTQPQPVRLARHPDRRPARPRRTGAGAAARARRAGRHRRRRLDGRAAAAGQATAPRAR